MSKIIKNFDALLDSKQLNSEEFNKLIKTSYLEDDSLKKEDNNINKLNKCIITILDIYPKMYSTIVDSTKNKHRYDKVERENKKYEEIFIRYIDEKDYRQAAKTFSMMTNIRLHKMDSIKLFENPEHATLFQELNNELAHLTTKDEMKKDVEQYLKNCISKITDNLDTFNHLVNYIVAEIILRINLPEEYSLSNFFINRSEFLLNELEIHERKNYLQDITNLVNQKKSAAEILKTLKLKYKIGNLAKRFI